MNLSSDSDLEQDYTRLENVEYKKLLCSWILKCKRESKNAEGTYVYLALIYRTQSEKLSKIAMNHLYASKKRLSNATELSSYAMKLRIQKCADCDDYPL